MTSLTCPKCRHGLPESALDAELCHLCGFPLDGPVLLVTPSPRVSRTRLFLAVGVTLLVAGAAGYVLFGLPGTPAAPSAVEVVTIPPTELTPLVPVRNVAPFPHQPRRPAPPSDSLVAKGDKGPPGVRPPPKKAGPRPLGVMMKVDPKIAPNRHFDHPDDTAALPDLVSGDRVVLTGRLRVLKLGSVHGKAVLDASGLVAEEVIVTGDLNGEAQVLLNAPAGTAKVGGYVHGTSKLTIAAPGGEVTVAGSGRISGGAQVTVTAKRLEVSCPVSGRARVTASITADGSLKLGVLEENATVTYRKAAENDPPLEVEKGVIRGAASVVVTD